MLGVETTAAALSAMLPDGKEHGGDDGEGEGESETLGEGDAVDVGTQLSEAMTLASCRGDSALSHTRRSVKAPGHAIHPVKDWPPCCGEFPHMAEPPTL